jgi:hypothetical protein
MDEKNEILDGLEELDSFRWTTFKKFIL